MGIVQFQDVRSTLPRHPSKTWPKRDVSRVSAIVLHHTAGNGTTEGTNRYHINPNHISKTGCPRICYTFSVERDGTVKWCNDLDDATYSQGTAKIPGDENAAYLGIVCQGDFYSQGNRDGREPTLRQIGAVIALVLHLTGEVRCSDLPGALYSVLGCSSADVMGHYDLGKSACPGDTLRAVIEAAKTHQTRLTTIADWQQALVDLEYDLGEWGPDKDGVDGEWGNASKTALVAFQRFVSIPVTGHRDAVTERALLNSLK